MQLAIPSARSNESSNQTMGGWAGNCGTYEDTVKVIKADAAFPFRRRRHSEDGRHQKGRHGSESENIQHDLHDLNFR